MLANLYRALRNLFTGCIEGFAIGLLELYVFQACIDGAEVLVCLVCKIILGDVKRCLLTKFAGCANELDVLFEYLLAHAAYLNTIFFGIVTNANLWQVAISAHIEPFAINCYCLPDGEHGIEAAGVYSNYYGIVTIAYNNLFVDVAGFVVAHNNTLQNDILGNFGGHGCQQLLSVFLLEFGNCHVGLAYGVIAIGRVVQENGLVKVVHASCEGYQQQACE